MAMAIGWDEEFCRRLDKLALEDHSYVPTYEERARREKTWLLALNTQGPTGQIRQRPDYADAVRIRNRLKSEAADEKSKNTSQQTSRQRASQSLIQQSQNQTTELILRQAGYGTLHLPPHVRHGGDQQIGGLHQAGMSIERIRFFYTGFACRQ